jgi:hypothetical protein
MFKSVKTYEVSEHLIEQISKAVYDSRLKYGGINFPRKRID